VKDSISITDGHDAYIVTPNRLIKVKNESSRAIFIKQAETLLNLCGVMRDVAKTVDLRVGEQATNPSVDFKELMIGPYLPMPDRALGLQGVLARQAPSQ
jgi:hypothetical protein